MVKKSKKPYDKFLLVMLAVFLAAGCLTPFSMDYVNNASGDFDKDMQATVILENVVMRLVERGDLILGKGLTSDEAEAKINAFMGDIPAVKQEGKIFCLNILNGKVQVKQHKEEHEIVLNLISGD